MADPAPMLRSPAMQIAGSTILVTGASSGIGAALAPMLAERGATVGIVARRRERLESVLTECQEHAPESRLWAVDLGDLDAAVAVAQDAWNGLGGLDCVVHNAAIPKRVPVTRLTADLVDETMRINFTSPVHMTLALLGPMLERGHGLTAFVSSVGGRIGIAHEAAYCASKFALAGFSEAMAIDLYGTGVGVKLLLPGSIETEIWDQPGNDPAQFAGPFITPGDCALSIVAALEDDGFEYFVPPAMPESDRLYEEVVQGKTGNVDGWIGAMGQMSRAHESGAG
jgi:short-subunit dehydrogenase